MIRVVIRRSELKAADACAAGLAWFNSVATKGVFKCTWDHATQVRFAVEARQWVGWAIEKNLVPITNLQGANLKGANLEGAWLRGARLQRAQLQGAQLEGAQLQDANLRGARLRGARLQLARLEGADLEYADLEGAQLQGAWLQGAQLQGAWLQGARYSSSTMWPEGFDPTAHNMTYL